MLKRVIFSFSVFSFLFVLSILVSVNTTVQTTSSVNFTQNPTKTIVIDAGHGGFDGGAVGYDGVIEKGINLDIALTLRDLFLINGFEVVMTRTQDVGLCTEQAKTIREKKTQDMKTRLDMIRANPNAIFISVHQNKFDQPSSSGAQIFYSKNNEKSELLASIIQRQMREKLQPENTREHKKSGKELYLLDQSDMPAVMVECGFLSNPEESKKLQDPIYQKQIAFVIFSSVMEFLKSGN